jgi:polysaccharide biosynthesis/export protein
MGGRVADLDSKPAIVASRAPWRAAFTMALIAMLAAGCSDTANQQNEVVGTNHATAMSPEQCMENGKIMRAAEADPGSYVIQPGDAVTIDFYLNQEFNQDVTVRPDGKVALRLVGNLQAAGLTPQQLAQEVDQAYSSELREPGATVVVKNMPSRQVFVDGQVSKPGMFPLEPGMTALQAVAEAGGLTENAGPEAVLIRRDMCGVPTGIPIKIKDAEKSAGGAEDVALQSRDIVVVPRSTISNMDLWVEQYVRNMLPIQPYLSITPFSPLM